MPTRRLSSIILSLRDRLNLSGKLLHAAIAGLILAMFAATAIVVMTTGPAQAAPDHTRTYGQDVSDYESDHDWSASPAQFGIIKATEGLTFRDPSFAHHWRELGKKGIVRGAYHYGHPGNDPIAEADYFLSVVNQQPAKPGDLLVLDLETTDGESVADVNTWAKTWLAHVKSETGVTPLFYSGWNFADTYGHGLADYPLWVAYYGRAKGDVTPPADWKTWTIHQYTDVPIDQNVSPLTPDQLRALGRP
ncbi:glycoside hydrolase family 25 protein [Sphaerisporangium perillae]|uniref:glycoside hydrolase family 25 protein n=1 Tax=Sphaerisporangium perillae TaxID=2935860 RepID=UPI00200D9911|nr:GH25 family lysozyme [Sphaerisporangium perillae]